MRAVLHATQDAVRRWLPAGVRPVLRDAAALLLPSAAPATVQASGRVTVAGLLSSHSGLGETARLSVTALAELGFTVGCIDLTEALGIPVDGSAGLSHPRQMRGDGGGPILLHLNPPNFQSALLLRGVPRRGRKLIAYWTWELPIVPPVWQRAFRLANEIWVPTHFVAEALRASGCTTPIRVVAYPVRRPASTNRIAKARLRVLTVFSYDSSFQRKNPLASIAAFRQAFEDRGDVELVVKARGHSATGEPERQFAAAIAGMDNITVQSGNIAPEQYAELLAQTDIVLSLHRSEGFGLVLAEAMLMGKPVVCTAWSGNLDFTTEATACLVPATLVPMHDTTSAYRNLRTQWAEPSVAAAADWLRRLQDPELRAVIGDAARHHMSDYLGPARFRGTIGDSLGSASCEIRTN